MSGVPTGLTNLLGSQKRQIKESAVIRATAITQAQRAIPVGSETGAVLAILSPARSGTRHVHSVPLNSLTGLVPYIRAHEARQFPLNPRQASEDSHRILKRRTRQNPVGRVSRHNHEPIHF